MHKIRRINEFINSSKDASKNDEKKTSHQRNISSYQKESLARWNPAYDVVDQYIWFPISPREEMATDQALLAMIEIFDELKMIDKFESHDYVTGLFSHHCHIFQFGDVLTICKWHGLGYHILRKMTTIGKDAYVSVMMNAFNSFTKIQDYLHENIH